jgi:hypothetical protein
MTQKGCAVSTRQSHWTCSKLKSIRPVSNFSTELINPGGPWRTTEQVEAATLYYVHWFNDHRLLEVSGDLPPIEVQQAYYRLYYSDLAKAE